MSGIRSVSLDYGDTRFSLYLIELPKECQSPTAPLPQGIQMHSHFYYEIHYATQGQCLYRFPDRELVLQKGQMLLIPPETLHFAQDLNPKTIQVISLSLSVTEEPGKFHPAVLSMLDAVACQPIAAPRGLPGYVDILQDRELYTSVLGICRLKAAAADLVRDLFQALRVYCEEPAAAPETPCDGEVTILLENMVNRPDITLEQIAAAVNYSTRHTARLIKSIYGASLSEIRRSRKKP